MRNLFNRVVQSGLLALLGVLSFHAHAESASCRVTRDQWVVQVPYTLGYAPGAADWSQITAPFLSTGADFFSCSGGRDGYRSLGFISADGAVGSVAAEDGSTRYVYKTQVDGIGYALGIREQQYCGGDGPRYIDGSNSVNAKDSRRICDSTRNADFASASQYALQFYVIFYKIPTSHPMQGDNTNTQEQNAGSLVLQAGDTPTSATNVAAPVQIRLASFTVRRSSCLVGTKSINVPMGSVNKLEFHGVNSTAGGASFSIPVTCAQSTAVKIGFFGDTSPSNASALALTHQPDSASGVGIQLRYGGNTGASQGQVVPFNTPQVPALGQGGNGETQVYSFDARYIQTDEKITAGKADAMATFNLIYN
ncbi:fimbrial protein [Intestinirhabdus alba]|jgi:type 1 fimbria pilin|uniref:Fimbrial protein n=1 Tax=Intestinirhabdus alba TaxID=2899544 RepID=A0A6L6ILA3_9ENTR|nr:fimbrial protein [Intestinirhabdus alba]MTH45503.1 fimbrial protein [Intestinirhabdus alba]